MILLRQGLIDRGCGARPDRLHTEKPTGWRPPSGLLRSVIVFSAPSGLRNAAQANQSLLEQNLWVVNSEDRKAAECASAV